MSEVFSSLEVLSCRKEAAGDVIDGQEGTPVSGSRRSLYESWRFMNLNRYPVLLILRNSIPNRRLFQQ